MIIGKPDFSDLTFTINDAVFRYGAFLTTVDHVRLDRGGGVPLRRQADGRDQGACRTQRRARRADERGADGAAPRADRREVARRRSRWDAQSSASRPTVSPGGSLAHAVEREQDAGHECLARGRVVADRERLPRPAEDHLLVRDEAGQPDRVDRHARRPSAAAVAFAVPDGASSFVSACSSTISARGNDARRLGGEAHHQHGAEREVRRQKHGRLAARAAASTAARSKPVVPITTGTPAARRRGRSSRPRPGA